MLYSFLIINTGALRLHKDKDQLQEGRSGLFFALSGCSAEERLSENSFKSLLLTKVTSYLYEFSFLNTLISEDWHLSLLSWKFTGMKCSKRPLNMSRLPQY